MLQTQHDVQEAYQQIPDVGGHVTASAGQGFC